MKTIDDLCKEAQELIATVKAKADGLKEAHDKFSALLAPFGQEVVFQQILPKEQEETFCHVMAHKALIGEMARVVLHATNHDDAAIKLSAFAWDYLPGATEEMRDARGQYGLTPELIEAILERPLGALAGIFAREEQSSAANGEQKLTPPADKPEILENLAGAESGAADRTKVKKKAVSPFHKTKDVTRHTYGQKVEDNVFILLGADFTDTKAPTFECKAKPPFSRAKKGRRGTERTVFTDVAAERLHLSPAMALYYFVLFSRLEPHGIAIVVEDPVTGYFELTDRAVRAIRDNNPAHIAALATLYRGVFVEPEKFPVTFKSVEEARKLAELTVIRQRGVNNAQEKLGLALSVSQQVDSSAASASQLRRVNAPNGSGTVPRL